MGFLARLFGKDHTKEPTKEKDIMVKVAIIYYSSTGTNYKMANWAKDAAEKEGAEVKLVKVPELAPMAAIESNPAWKAHYEATQDVPEATMDDLDWQMPSFGAYQLALVTYQVK